MPERFDYWGIPEWVSPDLVVYSVMFLSAFILLVRFILSARLWWQVGRPEKRWDKLHVRLGRLINYGIIQTKVLRQRYPGVMHVALAWGFFAFFLGTALATIDSHFYKFLEGNIYLLYKLVLDLFTVFFLFGAGLAAYRRFIQKPSHLTLKPGFTLSLVLITVIVLSGLIVESLRLAVEQPDWAIWSPAGWLLSLIWMATGASDTTLINWHLGLWGFHLFTIAATLVTLPAGTLLHTLTGPMNAFFSQTTRGFGELAPLTENAKGEQVYVSTLRDLTWKQLLDGDACTECGRCQDACPAHAAGTPLSPKQLILSMRDALRRDGATLLDKDHSAEPLVGKDISDDVLWSCTTCGACIQECPVLIEHLDIITDMRRHLVIEGRVDDMLQEALANLGRYGNSFGQSDRFRAKWTQGIQPPVKDARKEAVDYLWFVGDYASYSSSMTAITQATADVFSKAGLNFGILYEHEFNAGNDVRRIGEEGLFEMLVEKNMKALNRSNFKSIVTTDPHSYNALKNEYPANGDGPLQVLHYTELIDNLIKSGQLKFTKKLNNKVTYHDPCYLGRYNGVYDAPRRVIQAMGCELVEMPRHADRAFCCGAGGGRIWMEEGTVKERPSEARIHEAVALDGVEIFVVACPKDVTMYKDAVKTTGQEGKLVVKDLMELISEAL
ncbi:MAG: heterodisulfide reductase-related iron-sulfur binding cluster [Chloroflexota bacterium]